VGLDTVVMGVALGLWEKGKGETLLVDYAPFHLKFVVKVTHSLNVDSDQYLPITSES